MIKITTKRYRCSEILQEAKNPDLSMLRDKPSFKSTISDYEGLFINYGFRETAYPYTQQNAYSEEREREVTVAVLENDEIYAKFLPTLGGRLWALYDKRHKKNIIYKNDVIRFRNLAIRNAWFSGGVEWNCGVIGHSPFTCSQMYCAKVKGANGEEVLRFYEYERIRGVYYQMDFWLEGKKILFEAQLGALRDIDYGIYPYTSSSNSIAAFSTIGAGIPQLHLDESIGVMKAYSTCVGEGPFVCELFGEEGEILRRAGNEYGAATGRPRRVGGFDVVASRYGARVQGATAIALTKLDILSYFDKIPVCVAYEIDGKRVDTFPTGSALNNAKPVYEYFDGWKEDISDCRSFDELPEAAKKYIDFIEARIGVQIKYISVGAERDSIITR